MTSKVRWERNGFSLSSSCAGWHAHDKASGVRIGCVFFDGCWFRTNASGLPGPLRYAGSQPLAAQALVRYVEAGGR